MKKETTTKRAERILRELRTKYPGAKSYDLDGRGMHFVAEVEPVSDHPEFDRAIEVIIDSKPHKHLKTTQYYTVLSGNLELHVGNSAINLTSNDKFTVKPGNIHWAKSNNESWVEICSQPGWAKEDHIVVDN